MAHGWGCRGEVEGMIAVVRGLPDASLAVTLHDGRRQYTLQPDMASRDKHTISTSTCGKYTTETSTDTRVTTRDAAGYRDSVAQACDDRYASSYQVSHCQLRPTSPPVQVSEFPPQRSDLSPGFGNFVIGGLGSGERTFSPTRATDSNFRGGAPWPDRGSACSPRPSREADTFVNSLRRYPNMSPDRSTDLVERLITYTQSKNLNKSLYNTRAGSLSKPKDASLAAVLEDLRNLRDNTASKNLQTYTRDKRANLINESPTRDVADAGKDTALHDHAKEAKANVRISAEYDYLAKKEDRSPGKVEDVLKKKTFNNDIDVRYLCDMTKSIRDRIKLMYDENVPCGAHACPRFQQRLSEHRRQYHGSCLDYRNSQLVDNGVQAKGHARDGETTCPAFTKKKTTAVSCAQSTTACCNDTASILEEECCPREDLSPPIKQLRPKSVRTSVTSREYCPKSSEYLNDSDIHGSQTNTEATYSVNDQSNRKSKSEEVISNHRITQDLLRKELREWLNELPVHHDESDRVKLHRENVIDKLEYDLAQMVHDFDGYELEVQMRALMGQALDNLPMWCPENKQDQVIFLQNIVDNLMMRVKKIKNGDSFGSFRNGLTIVERSQFPNKRGKDDFKRIIVKWINSLPFASRDYHGNIVDKDQIAKEVEQRLKPLALIRPECKSMYKQIIKENAIDLLNQMPIRAFCCNKEEKIKEFAQKLGEELSKINIKNEQLTPSACCIRPKKRPDQTIQDDIYQSVVDEIDEVVKQLPVNITVSQRSKIANDISSMLLKSPEIMRGEDDSRTRQDLFSLLREIPNLSVGDANEITNNILSKARDISLMEQSRNQSTFGDSRLGASKIRASTPKINSRDTSGLPDISAIVVDEDLNHKEDLEETVMKWLDESSLNPNERRKRVRQLTDRLAMSDVHDLANEPKMKKDIEDWIRSLPSGKPHKLSLDRVTNNLIAKIKLLPERNKSKMQAKTTGQLGDSTKLADQISYWLHELPMDHDTSENINKYKDDLIARIQNNKGSDNAIRSEVINWLNQIPINSEFYNKRPEMADKLMARLKKIPVDNIPARNTGPASSVLPIQDIAPAQDQSNVLQNEISKWIDNLPIDLKSSPIKDNIKQEIATEILDRQKYLKENPDKSLSEEDEKKYMEYQIFKSLRRIPDNLLHSSQHATKLGNNVNDLISKISGIRKKTQHPDNKQVNFAEDTRKDVEDWLRSTDLSKSLDETRKNKLIDDLSRTIASVQNQPASGRNLQNEVEQCVKKVLPLEKQTDSSHIAASLVQRINDKSHVSQSQDQSTSFKTLSQEIAKWCNELPVYTGNSDYDHKQRETMLIEVMFQILNKVWALAVDDKLSEEDDVVQGILEKEIRQLLDDLPQSPELEGAKASMTSALVKKIIENKHCFLSPPVSIVSLGALERSSMRRQNVSLDTLKMELNNFMVNWFRSFDDYYGDMSPTQKQELQSEMKFILLSKAFELLNDPVIMEDHDLFHDLMCEEIKMQLDKLPHNPELHRRKHALGLQFAAKLHSHRDAILGKRTEKRKFHDLTDEAGETHRHFKSVDSDGIKHFYTMEREKTIKNSGSYALDKSLFQRSNVGAQPLPGYQTFEGVAPASSSLRQNAPHYAGQRSLANRSHGNNHNMSTNNSMRRKVLPSSPIEGSPVRYDDQPMHFTSLYSNSTMNESPSQYQRAPNQYCEPCQQSSQMRSSSDMKKILSKEISMWCNKLPVFQGNTAEDQEKKDSLHLQLVLNVLQKVNELSVNPVIFHDDNLFEDLMNEEVEKMLNTLPMNPELQRTKRMLAIELSKKLMNHKDCFDRTGVDQESVMAANDHMIGTVNKRSGIQNIREMGIRRKWNPGDPQLKYGQQDNSQNYSFRFGPAREMEPSLQNPPRYQNVDTEQSLSRNQQPMDQASYRGMSMQPFQADVSPKLQSSGGVRNVPIRQMEAESQTEVQTKFHHHVVDPAGGSAILERKSIRDNLEHFALNAPDKAALDRLMTSVQREAQNKLSQIQNGVGPSGLNQLESADNISISPADSQSLARWMTKMNPKPDANYPALDAATNGKTSPLALKPCESTCTNTRNVEFANGRSRDNVPLNISGRVRGRTDHEIEGQYDLGANGNFEEVRNRMMSFDDMAPDGFSTPVNMHLPNDWVPQRPRKGFGAGLRDEDRWAPQRGRTEMENLLENDEARTRCHCKEQPVHRSSKKQKLCHCYKPGTFPRREMMKQCPKCCGFHCPFPSFLYFR